MRKHRRNAPSLAYSRVVVTKVDLQTKEERIKLCDVRRKPTSHVPRFEALRKEPSFRVFLTSVPKGEGKFSFGTRSRNEFEFRLYFFISFSFHKLYVESYAK